jgi:hypothetical protein
VARRRLIGEISFDLKNPPPLNELLKSDENVRHLKTFAESIFCEEIISFYAEATEWKKSKSTSKPNSNSNSDEIARNIVLKYVDNDSVMCLNLEHDVRENAVKAVQAENVPETVFDDVL